MPTNRTYELAPSPPPPMDWPKYRAIILENWSRLLSSDASEGAVQRFLERHPCLLPGQFGPIGSGHGPFPPAIISQPALPDFTRKLPDFMWIARDSLTIYPILIEIEAPAKRWFSNSGVQTADLTRALNQLAEWKAWFQRPLNAGRFHEYYRIPNDLRSLKPLYALIYGRRSEATRTSELRDKRLHLAREDEHLMTYDRLEPRHDARNYFCVKIDKDGYRAITVPPTMKLGPLSACDHALIRAKEEATQDSPYLSESRRQFLIDRFPYWDQWCRERERRGFELYSTQDWE
jgi:hypothetical protein